MNILLFLIPVSMALLLVAVWAFRWAVRKGQFENLDAAAIDILRDDSADAGSQATGDSAPDSGITQPDQGPRTAGEPGPPPGGSARAD